VQFKRRSSLAKRDGSFTAAVDLRSHEKDFQSGLKLFSPGRIRNEESATVEGRFSGWTLVEPLVG